MNMVKTIAVVGLAAACLSGCKSTPSKEDIYTASYSVGVAGGLIADNTIISDTNRTQVVAIVRKVRDVIPASGQSFEEAWTPIAKEHVAELVARGDITETQGALILRAFSFAAGGVDYLKETYPDVFQYEDLVRSAANGVCDGFLSVFDKSSRGLSAGTASYDADAYRWLKDRKRR